jgi:hypothetical protein
MCEHSRRYRGTSALFGLLRPFPLIFWIQDPEFATRCIRYDFGASFLRLLIYIAGIFLAYLPSILVASLSERNWCSKLAKNHYPDSA